MVPSLTAPSQRRTNNVHPRSQNGLHDHSRSQRKISLIISTSLLTRILNKLLRWQSGPEKAGVGGSIPSLATISNNLQTCFSEFGCIWLHFDHTTALRLPLLPTVLRTLRASGLPCAATQERPADTHPASCSLDYAASDPAHPSRSLALDSSKSRRNA